MIFSPSTEYALHALIYLAEENVSKPALVREIAEAENIPRHFLAKILNQLDHRRIVKSTKGPGGGFTLARPAEKIKVSEVAGIFDDLTGLDRVCILGLDKCQDAHSCALHTEWKGFRQLLKKRINQLSIRDIQLMRQAKRKQ